MRAHYLEDLKVQEIYTLVGESLHHLVHVVRVEFGEELLLINGKGLSVRALIEQISKRELKLKFLASSQEENNAKLDLVLGMPKREALDLCLKQVVELGFRNVYLVKSDYSQMRFPEKERVQSLMISALEQSNAKYFPNIIESGWDGVSFSDYQEILFFDSQTKKNGFKTQIITQDIKLLVIGPEGGFSKREIERLNYMENVRSIYLPTPILRTPTALAVASGIALRALID